MEWRPIETAPVSEDIFLEDVSPCLVYGPDVGVRIGRAWRYADGTVGADSAMLCGDWEYTHWMPLPAPPSNEMRYEFDETKVDDVIRAAYDLSTPQGLGFLHARPGGLDDETIARIKESESGLYAARMDYVHGRAVKLTIRRDGDICYIPADSWFDHSLDHLRELAKRADLGEPKATGEV